MSGTVSELRKETERWVLQNIKDDCIDLFDELKKSERYWKIRDESLDDYVNSKKG